MSSEWFCRWTDRERQALPGVGPLAMAMYEVLRFQMDYTTGLVGRRTPISWDGLAWELRTETNRGRGCQITRPTLQEMRGAVDRLIGKGLLKRVGGKDFLSFLCPFAFVAPVRPNQTQQSGNSQSSTEHNRLDAFNGAGFDGFDHIEISVGEPPNSTDIREVWIGTPPQPSSTDSTGVYAGDDFAGEGLDRDRPSASQAGQLTQPGKTQEIPDRDRPAGSHPAQSRRLGGRALPAGTPAGGGEGATHVCSAENESAAVASATATDGLVDALASVMQREGMRPPTLSKDLMGVAGWAANGVTPLELKCAIDVARAARLKAGDMQPLNIGYVSSVIRSERSKARRAAEQARRVAEMLPKKRVDAELEGLARSIGMWPARPGEAWPNYRGRVLAAAEAQMGRGHG